MQVIKWLLFMVIPAWVVLYTWNFGRFLWQRKFTLGAIGSYFLAIIAGLGAMIFFYLQVFAL